MLFCRETMFRQACSSLKQSGQSIMQHQQRRSLGSLVSAEELKSALGRVKVLDGSWHMPNTNRDPYQEYLKKRIAGSQFFGIDTIKDTTSDLPHMLPSPDNFADAVGKLGISNDDHIVVYDTTGVFSACRVYWTFKAFGHESVSVLNGGLPIWEKANGPIETSEPNQPVQPKIYKPHPINTNLVRDYQYVLANAKKIEQHKDGGDVVLDARPNARFTGEAPEPRAGLSSGHMPGSISVAFNEIVDPTTGEMLDDKRLHQVFCDQKGIDLSKPIITSCGSGITASILYLGLERIGAKNLAVYDGSWTEYASKPDAIIVKDH